MKRFFLLGFGFITYYLFLPIFDLLATANGDDEDFKSNFGGAQKDLTPHIVSKNEKENISKASKGKILIVDDSVVIQKIIIKMLQGTGYIIEIANDGLEAVSKCQCEEFDFILMDIEMPKMNGEIATKKIREGNLNKGTPIIASTTLQEYRTTYSQHSMDAYVAKPIQKLALLSAMDKVLLEKNKQSSSLESKMKDLKIDKDNNLR